MILKNKLIISIYIFIILTLIVITPSYATTNENEIFLQSYETRLASGGESPDDFIENITTSTDKWTQMAQDKAKEMGLDVSTTIKPFLPLIASQRFIAQAVIFIAAMIMAIRWNMGSPDQKAKSKKRLILWIIGAALVIGGIEIWGKIMLVGSELSTGESSAGSTAYITTDLV